MSVDFLRSWSEGANKEAILDFVAAVTEQGGERELADDRISSVGKLDTAWDEAVQKS